MTIELEPVGVVCNLSCPYCYEHPMRDAGNFRHKTYSVEKMLEGLAKEGGNFTLSVSISEPIALAKCFLKISASALNVARAITR